jgi:aryl-alcohol dehydrogenase-like predicted oxidoreductase
LKNIARQKDVTASQIAIDWTLSRPAVSSVVIGGRTLEQIKNNINASNVKLTDEELLQLNKISKVPILYPYWHQGNFAYSRLSEADKVLLSDFKNIPE